MKRLSSRIRTSCSDQLADLVIPCGYLVRSKKALVEDQISAQRCCKCRAVIVRRAGIPCALMTLTLSVCHAWGNLIRRCDTSSLNAPAFLCFHSIPQLNQRQPHHAILKTFYSGAIESVLTQCISVWYGNSSKQDCKALQRVVRLAERISGSTLPSLQVIYLKRCKSRAAKIIKDSNHPGNHLFRLLPSGKRFRSMMAKTERLRRSFFPQAIRLLNTNSV